MNGIQGNVGQKLNFLDLRACIYYSAFVQVVCAREYAPTCWWWDTRTGWSLSGGYHRRRRHPQGLPSTKRGEMTCSLSSSVVVAFRYKDFILHLTSFYSTYMSFLFCLNIIVFSSTPVHAASSSCAATKTPSPLSMCLSLVSCWPQVCLGSCKTL